MREQLLAQHRVTAEQVVEQLARLPRERADDADARERLAHAAVDALDVLADASGRSAGRGATNAKLISITPGMMARAVSASRQFSSMSTVTRDDQPDERDRRRHDRHLQQPGRRLDVAGEPRQDAAGLHVPQLRQRQVEQPVEERAPQRQHDLRVQQALAIVLEHADQVGEDDDADEGHAREVELGQPRLEVQCGVEEHAVDDEPHEERLDHLEPGAEQRQDEDSAGREAMRPEPTDVVAQERASFGVVRPP